MIETRLQCSHKLLWRTAIHAPKSGERVWCPECRDMRAVVSKTGEWIARCCGCHWHKTYMRLETMRDRVTEHVRRCGNPVVIQDHNQTVSYTVRTPRAASHLADTGHDSASTSTMRKVGSPDTLF